MFGENLVSYDEILKEIPSDTVIMLLIAINAELNSEEEYFENQRRIFRLLSYRYTDEQLSLLNDRISKYKKRTVGYDGTLFGRRYLLFMILKELKRDNKVDVNDNNLIQEYNFLLAYLLTVDEVNNKDHDLLRAAKRYDLKIMPEMPLIWSANISQYEYNDYPNSAFELFKLLSFCKYSLDNYKMYLKELINKYAFKNISELMESFNQIVKSTLGNRSNEFFKKLSFIVPLKNVHIGHLESLCINYTKKKDLIDINDLRRFPLYETRGKGFMVIDSNMYAKKIYRGPLFELNKETSMREEINFDIYKNQVSKKCFEEILFKGIVKQLTQKDSIVHYDLEKGIGEPDLFYRYKNDVFLIEFKDYLFPDSLIKGESFGAFKSYIEERFLCSKQGKAKGVRQLSNCVQNLLSKKYQFDPELNEMLMNGKEINIHSIICHTDFMFSMPGINEYLNRLFYKEFSYKRFVHRGINKVTIIDLEVLFDLALRGGDFLKLLNFVREYYKRMENARKKAAVTSNIEDFIPSTASFDEVYETIYRSSMITDGILTDSEKVNRMIDIIGITQDEMEEIL